MDRQSEVNGCYCLTPHDYLNSIHLRLSQLNLLVIISLNSRCVNAYLFTPADVYFLSHQLPSSHQLLQPQQLLQSQQLPYHIDYQHLNNFLHRAY